MSERQLFSPHWNRLAGLRPRLRPQIGLHRHRVRGEIWFVLQDRQSGAHHRLNRTAWRVLGLMNGRRSVDAIWRRVLEEARADSDTPLTQDDVVQLLAQLHSADLLLGGAPTDLAELARRGEKQRTTEMLARIKNPLAIRIPLVDPDRLLTATLPAVRWLFTWVGFALWLALVAWGGWLAVSQWDALTDDVFDRVLSAQNVALLVAIYPLVKGLHELGHGWAAKAWGGEVREMGVMFLIFLPVPYVDASSAAAFPSRRQRIVVGAAGMMVELALAAAAMIVWVAAEPGLLRAAAFNVALIGGVSSLLFNGNPLLRFDGYYVLADAIDIPNLAQRSNKYLGYLAERYAFGVEAAQSPVQAPGERGWFVFYAVAAFAYRIFIALTIAVLVSQMLFFLGVALAILSLFNTVLWPLAKGLRYLAVSPRLDDRRGRAWGLTGAALVALGAGLFAVPAPLATLRPGVVIADEARVLRAKADGAVIALPAPAGATVGPGQAVLRQGDPLLETEARIVLARLAEIRARHAALPLEAANDRDILREQARRVLQEAQDLSARAAGLTLSAAAPGTILTAGGDDLVGRWLRQGELVGHVIAPGPHRIQVALTEVQADLVRARPGAVTLRPVDKALADPLPAQLVRVAPAPGAALPHPALTDAGGGPVLRDPREPNRALQPWFDAEVAVVSDRALPPGFGVMVRFDHGAEPLGLRVWRYARRQFLGLFDV